MQFLVSAGLVSVLSLVWATGFVPGEPPSAPPEIESRPVIAKDSLRPFSEMLKAVAQREPSWTATFEETATSTQGDKSTTTITKGRIAAHGSKYLVKLLSRDGQLVEQTLVVEGDRVRLREPDRIVLTRTVSSVWCLPLLAPNDASFRSLGIPPSSKWQAASRSEEGDKTRWKLDCVPASNGVVSQVNFDVATRSGNLTLSRIAWTVEAEPGSGKKPLVSVALDTEKWFELDRLSIPSAIVRSSTMQMGEGQPDLKAIQRLVLSEVRALSEAEATNEVDAAAKPRAGDVIEDEESGMQIESGGTWVEIRGERFQLSRAVIDLPIIDLADILIKPKSQQSPEVK